MTPTELRALADALEPMARAPRFEDFDVPGFCEWVRACADAKPVGYVTANGLRSLRQNDATVLLYPHDYLIRPDQVAVYTHPAMRLAQVVASFYTESAELIGTTYAPIKKIRIEDDGTLHVFIDHWPQQAEPKLGELMREQRNSRIVAGAYPDGNPNAGAIMAQTSQAEPKREALHGLAPTHRCPACGAFWRQCDDASWNLRSASCCGLCDAGRVELVCWLDEPKREPLSDEREARLTRERDEARAERDAMANVLPGVYYMDPPDGGDVSLLKQLQRMSNDAARYRLLRRKFAIISDGEGNAEFCPINLPRPTYIAPNTAIELDTALDRERLGLDGAKRPPTPVGWSDTDWIKHLQEQAKEPK